MYCIHTLIWLMIKLFKLEIRETSQLNLILSYAVRYSVQFLKYKTIKQHLPVYGDHKFLKIVGA